MSRRPPKLRLDLVSVRVQGIIMPSGHNDNPEGDRQESETNWQIQCVIVRQERYVEELRNG